MTDVIFDGSLTFERLAFDAVVILNQSTCLLDEPCDALRQHVTNGGMLLATMETSLYDEWGNRQDNFALANLFGVDHVASHKEAAQILVPQTDELGRFVTFVSPAVEFKFRAGSNVEELLTKSSVLLYTLSVKSQPYDSGKPAVVRHCVGKGQVIYLGADVARGYSQDNLP